ncbi:MAG TPA: class I SAM-dependent methyltransferase [Acidobacteriota bacterium]|nr:class I SAM-dependent methyltransferase [Acidobacteriota bacterium]
MLESLKQLSDVMEKSRQRKIPIITDAKAAFLLDLVKKKKPAKILELGTANGVSATVLTAAGGAIVTIDSDEKTQQEAFELFDRFQVDARVITGDGIEALEELVLTDAESFDFIFIDFMKRKYLEALPFCLKLAKKGAIIVADNVTNEKCADFLKEIQQNKKVTTTLVEIDDAMTISEVK